MAHTHARDKYYEQANNQCDFALVHMRPPHMETYNSLNGQRAMRRLHATVSQLVSVCVCARECVRVCEKTRNVCVCARMRYAK